MTIDKNNQVRKNEANYIDPTCHKCSPSVPTSCLFGKTSKTLDNCPMIISPETQKKAREIYDKDEFIKKSTGVASTVEASGYIKWPRLKDTIEYAKAMGFKKIGLAFCVGLLEEACKVGEILKKYRFKVVSVCCKTGGVKKKAVGVPEEFIGLSKTGYPIGYITCNPVAQALILNKANTELNLIIGLCVGHDVAFTKLSNAPVSTLIAKDRSMPHNPSGVLFTHYGRTFFQKDLEETRKTRIKTPKKES